MDTHQACNGTFGYPDDTDVDKFVQIFDTSPAGNERGRVAALDDTSNHMQIRNFSFGATAAIVTSMGLIIGLDAATATKATILSGLLIVAIADNLTDSLSVHIYQESERLEPRVAFHATLVHVPKLITAYYARFPAMLWRRPRSRRGFRPRQI